MKTCRLYYTQKTAATPESHPIPRDRSTAPIPTHTAALAIPGERTGVAAKLGERRFFKVSLPETASNHYIPFWLSDRVLDSGQAERQFKSPCLCFFAFSFFFFAVLLYCCCTVVPHVVGSWVVVGRWVLLLCSVLYCCTTCCCSAVAQGGCVGCLLYTSPSPRDLSTSRMPSSA